MDTAVPTTPDANPASGYSPYVWQDADSDAVTPTQAMNGGPQVSQPSGEIDGLPAKDLGPVKDFEPAKVETPRAATMRRVATAAAGVGLMAAAVLTARSLRGDNAKAGANVIDYDD